MIKKLLAFIFCVLAFISLADAKGGFSSGGGRGGFSSGGSRSTSASPSRSSVSSPSRTITTTTTTRSYSSRYVGGGGMMYGGMGMGYGYSNGLLTGLIIGNMLHPTNTVVYSGPGDYSNNALLYPDGRVVNQQGYQVGNYVNGVFTPVHSGQMVAQSVPVDAYQSQPSQPVVIRSGIATEDVVLIILLTILGIFMIFFLITL